MRDRRWFVFFGSTVLALAICGCGVKMVTVKGKITKGGQPLAVSKETYVTLSFLPTEAVDKAKTSYNAKFDHSDGSYSISLPAGKYKTMLVVVPPGALSESQPNAPKPVSSDKVHDLNSSQSLDIEMTAK